MSLEIQESSEITGVTMLEGHAIWDCDAALDGMEKWQMVVQLKSPPRLQKTSKFGGDGDPVEASFPVTLPILIGDTTTWIEASPGSTSSFDFSTAALSASMFGEF